MIYLENILEISNTFFWYYIIIVLTVVVGFYFSMRIKFENIKSLKNRVLSLLNSNNKTAIGISPFKAACMDCASSLGAGNIISVAIAISLGGPGAIFWMWILAIISSATTFIESTISQIYKLRDNLKYRGGPSYYMKSGLGNRTLGIVFSLLLIFSVSFIFNSIQSNLIKLSLSETFNLNETLISVSLFLLISVTVLGGLRRISSVVSTIIPISMILYVIMGVVALALNISEIPNMLYSIISSAFDFKSILGGGLGATISCGARSGLFLGKAGSGLSPNIASTAGVSHPVRQGFFHSIVVLINTIIIGSITSFIILLSDVPLSTGQDPLDLVSYSFSYHFGDFGPIILSVFFFLFLFSSIVSNYYHGENNVLFLENSKQSLNIYRLGFIFVISFGLIPNWTIFWNIASIGLAIMYIINIISVLVLSKIGLNSLENFKTNPLNNIGSGNSYTNLDKLK